MCLECGEREGHETGRGVGRGKVCVDRMCIGHD